MSLANKILAISFRANPRLTHSFQMIPITIKTNIVFLLFQHCKLIIDVLIHAIKLSSFQLINFRFHPTEHYWQMLDTMKKSTHIVKWKLHVNHWDETKGHHRNGLRMLFVLIVLMCVCFLDLFRQTNRYSNISIGHLYRNASNKRNPRISAHPRIGAHPKCEII